MAKTRGLQGYTVQEAQNAGLGQAGAIFKDGSGEVSGTITAIQFVEDSIFTTLTPESSSYIGTSGGSGDAIGSGNIFVAGMTIYGSWTGFNLTSGSVIAYLG